MKANIRPCFSWALLGAWLWLAGCASGRPPEPRNRLGRRLNRLDKQQERHGKWRVFYDSLNTKPYTRGRYRHGMPVGRWRYYSPLALDRTEHYLRHNRVTLKTYHSNGRLARRGQARFVNEPTGLHYYWYGPWRVYSNQTGQLEKIETYANGHLESSRLVK